MDFENTIFHPDWVLGLLEYLRRVFLLSSVRTAILTTVPYLLINVLTLSLLNRIRIQQKKPSHRQTRSEFIYFLINFFIFHSMVVIPVFFLQRFGIFAYNFSKIDPIQFCLELGLVVIGHDLFFYWTHRFMHVRGIFRLVHSIHHRSTNPTVITAYNFHPLESIINSSYIAFLFLIAGIVNGGLYFMTFMAFMMINSLWNVYIHSGLELMPRSIALLLPFRFFVTGTHHNLHHSHNAGNYGLYLSVWDRIFGTLSPNYEQVLQKRKDE